MIKQTINDVRILLFMAPWFMSINTFIKNLLKQEFIPSRIFLTFKDFND